MDRYTIRYRCGDLHGQIALIVDDARGDAYLFCGGCLQVRQTGHGAGARLAHLIGRRAACVPVPEVAPYTLDDLQHLAAPTASHTVIA